MTFTPGRIDLDNFHGNPAKLFKLREPVDGVGAGFGTLDFGRDFGRDAGLWTGRWTLDRWGTSDIGWRCVYGEPIAQVEIDIRGCRCGDIGLSAMVSGSRGE